MSTITDDLGRKMYSHGRYIPSSERELPPVHGERYRRQDGTCGCDMCRFGGAQRSGLASALRHDLPLGF